MFFEVSSTGRINIDDSKNHFGQRQSRIVVECLDKQDYERCATYQSLLTRPLQLGREEDFRFTMAGAVVEESAKVVCL